MADWQDWLKSAEIISLGKRHGEEVGEGKVDVLEVLLTDGKVEKGVRPFEEEDDGSVWSIICLK